MTNSKLLIKSFTNKDLLNHALTHKSWVNENKNKRASNERLEFLGDAILEYVVSKELYNKFPGKEEGYLTALRANLVNTKNLSKVATNIGLGELIFLSKGEEDGGGRSNPSLLADTTEAIIGAIFFDRGLSAVESFIKSNILVDLSVKLAEPLKDAKSRLQELVQAKGDAAPRYKVIEQNGPDHEREFVVGVYSEKVLLAKGKGKSKSEAEQEAANIALKNFAK